MKYFQQVDDPPYLPVGTAVSAKYKGAFCEAKVSKVVRVVKCKASNYKSVELFIYINVNYTHYNIKLIVPGIL